VFHLGVGRLGGVFFFDEADANHFIDAGDALFDTADTFLFEFTPVSLSQ